MSTAVVDAKVEDPVALDVGEDAIDARPELGCEPGRLAGLQSAQYLIEIYDLILAPDLVHTHCVHTTKTDYTEPCPY